MKTILLLGDSVRQNYEKYVEDYLRGKATVIYTRDNNRFCQYTLRYVNEWINALTYGDASKIDIIHFNCGLWDVVRLSNEDRTFTSPDEYRDLLNRIYLRLRYLCPNASIIFALTTAVIEPGMDPTVNVGVRRNSDIRLFNDIAIDFCNKSGIAVNDLWTVSQNLPDNAYSDYVHFDTDIGKETLGSEVARQLVKLL